MIDRSSIQGLGVSRNKVHRHTTTESKSKSSGFQSQWKKHNKSPTPKSEQKKGGYNVPFKENLDNGVAKNRTRKSEAKEQSAKDTIDLRYDKFQLLLSSPVIKMEDLKKLCWNGIPVEFRPECWKLLLGYMPLVRERWQETLEAKRNKYWANVPNMLDASLLGQSEYENTIFDQIDKDVPRTNPSTPIFQIDGIQRIIQRILYTWSLRHPSGYVQGINDLVTPFLIVFLQPYLKESDPEKVTDISYIKADILKDVEADCYWCFSEFIDSIHDHYTFAQPGIQRLLYKLKELIKQIDAPLDVYLTQQKIDYIQFAFRWMNCLLMRELPLTIIIRMWDTYFSEEDNFACIHVYMCAALLVTWSYQILSKDFQEFFFFIQNLPTEQWIDQDIETLLSQAYLWKTLYNDSQGHLKSNQKV